MSSNLLAEPFMDVLYIKISNNGIKHYI